MRFAACLRMNSGEWAAKRYGLSDAWIQSRAQPVAAAAASHPLTHFAHKRIVKPTFFGQPNVSKPHFIFDTGKSWLFACYQDIKCIANFNIFIHSLTDSIFFKWLPCKLSNAFDAETLCEYWCFVIKWFHSFAVAIIVDSVDRNTRGLTHKTQN